MRKKKKLPYPRGCPPEQKVETFTEGRLVGGITGKFLLGGERRRKRKENTKCWGKIKDWGERITITSILKRTGGAGGSEKEKSKLFQRQKKKGPKIARQQTLATNPPEGRMGAMRGEKNPRKESYPVENGGEVLSWKVH